MTKIKDPPLIPPTQKVPWALFESKGLSMRNLLLMVIGRFYPMKLCDDK